jgi:hypothetical protein
MRFIVCLLALFCIPCVKITSYTNQAIVLTLLCWIIPSAFGFDDQGFRFITAEVSQESAARGRSSAFTSLDADVTSGVFDPGAGKLLDAAQSFTKAVFSLPSLELVRATTRRDDGDVLIVKWAVNEPFAKGSLILQDLPYSSSYEFRLTGVGIQSKDDVANFLTKLLTWNKPPTNFVPSAFYVYSGSGPVRAYLARSYQSSSADLRNVTVGAATLDGAWFIEVELGKDFTRGYYPVTPFVPERFPPLEELVKSWGFNRIWGEVGRPVGPDGSQGYSHFRDDILVTELIRRGLTEEQFVELLSNVDSVGLGTRAQVVLFALQQEGKGASLGRYFGPALRMYEHIGPGSSDAVETLFRFAAAACSKPYEAEAARLLKSGTFPNASLLYVSRCSASQDVLEAVSSADVPDKLLDAKKFALMDIRKRLGLPPE